MNDITESCRRNVIVTKVLAKCCGGAVTESTESDNNDGVEGWDYGDDGDDNEECLDRGPLRNKKILDFIAAG
eukprot:jgi/Bigna1/135014/aug1.27_g9722